MPIYMTFGKPVDDYCELWSVPVGSQTVPAAGGAPHRAQVDSLSVSKGRDSLSGQLFQHCAVGTTFGTVWVEFYRGTTARSPISCTR
jgi:type VI protein secretion system component Hcp